VIIGIILSPITTFFVANKNLHVLTLDIQDLEGFSKFAKQVDDIVGKEGLNLLINNAGMLYREKDRVSADHTIGKSWSQLPLSRASSQKIWWTASRPIAWVLCSWLKHCWTT